MKTLTAATWADADLARFLRTATDISEAVQVGLLAIEIAEAVVNCPFVEINLPTGGPHFFTTEVEIFGSDLD